MLKKFGQNLGYGWILYTRYIIVARGPGLSSFQAECVGEQSYFNILCIMLDLVWRASLFACKIT